MVVPVHVVFAVVMADVLAGVVNISVVKQIDKRYCVWH